MVYCHFIAVNYLALEVSVDFVKVKSVVSRNEALCLEDVCAQFVDVASCSREVTCHCDTSVQ